MNPEIRTLLYLLSSAVLICWLLNPRLGLIGTALLVVFYLWGRLILGKMDIVITRFEAAVRHHLRRSGNLYCPECALALNALKDLKPLPHYRCPACSGAWCGWEELSGAGSRRGREWQPDPPADASPPLPCPKCRRRLERGGWIGAPITAHRCRRCSGVWVAHLDWVLIEMEPR